MPVSGAQSIYMKRSFFVFLVILVLSGCLKDSVTEQYTFYRPVYYTREEVMSNIKSSAATDIVQPGKIVLRDHYIFLNELDKGIHVIDIANPASPVNLAFIEIPGCVDMAVNGNYLYADSYKNLAALDITDPTKIVLKQFLDKVFPERYYQGFQPDNSLIIKGWVKVDTSVHKRFEGSFNFGVRMDSQVFMMYSASASQSGVAFSSGGVSVAGSLARFGLQNNRLYTISNTGLKIFNITAPANPTFVSGANLMVGTIETIFPYKNNLFIGGQSGMFIYNVSNPDQPVKTSQFTHARSCDPVIAEDKYAYVTLSGGSSCGGFSNQLDVVDISNLNSPSLVKTYNLTSPRGLSKDGNVLLICDGKDGLKIFDAANASQVSLLKQVSGFEPMDVIALQGIAIVTAKDGLYFVNYSNVANASVISKIQITKNK
jgi:hypothetical protein